MGNWDNLSMRDKRDVMRLHIQNGIRDLNSIRESYNTYANGGNIYGGPQPGSNQMQLSPLQPKTRVANYSFAPGKYSVGVGASFNSESTTDAPITPNNIAHAKSEVLNKFNDWYSGRDDQLKENILSSIITPKTDNEYEYPISKIDEEGSVSVSRKKDAVSVDSEKNKGISNIKNSKVVFDSDRINSMYPGSLVQGVFDINKVVLPSDGGSMGTLVHEYAHASNQIYQENKIKSILKNSVAKYGDPYWDSPNEIYARLMDFRLNNNLDPRHLFTDEEVDELIKRSADHNSGLTESELLRSKLDYEKNIIENKLPPRVILNNKKSIIEIDNELDYRNKTGRKSINSKNIFDRYDKKTIKRLLNEVAQNKQLNQLPNNFLNNNIT